MNELLLERSDVDEHLKAFLYSTLIPPPMTNDDSTGVRGTCVFVMELNVDLSCDFVSPHTIQDPTYIHFDEDVLRIRLGLPLISFNEPSFLCHRWHRQCLLSLLSTITKDYGNVESSRCFSTFQYNLNTVCDASSNVMHDGKDVFYENFILSVVIHCLKAGVKSINNDLLHSTGKRNFKFVYMPSMLHLLKSLDTLRRTFDLKQELTDAELLNKKAGSMMGALIKKREELLNSAD